MEPEITEVIYAFLKDYLIAHGYPPTVREAAAHCELSHSSILKYLKLLERQGLIARKKGTARGITLLLEPAAEPDQNLTP